MKRLKLQVTGIILLFLAISVRQAYGQPANTYTNEEVLQSADYGNGNKYQKDFLLFMDLIVKQHSISICDKFPFDVEALRKEGYQRVLECQDDTDFYLYLQSIMASLHDGHSTVMNAFNSEYLYPLSVFIDENGIHVNGIQLDMNAGLGKTIKAINGKTVSEATDQFCKLISYANIYEKRKLLRAQISTFNLWHYAGLCNEDSSLVLTFTDDTSVKLYPVKRNELKMDAIRVANFSSPRTASKMPFSYKLFPDKKICYLQFDLCQDRNTIAATLTEEQRTAMANQLSKYPVWSEFLNTMFNEMAEEKIKTLVVDLRKNAGGNSSLCEELILRLSSKPIKTHKRVDSSMPYTPGVRYMAGKNSDIPTFKGKVIFIQGEQTYSSAGLLATYAYDNKIGQLIGDCGSYSPTHYGHMLTWLLPNTQTTVMLSSARFIRPNENVTEPFIKPQVYIPDMFEDFKTGTDKCWEWILTHQK